MADARPFLLVDSLFKTSERIWFSLTLSDHLEAFRTTPRLSGLIQNESVAGVSAGEKTEAAPAPDDSIGPLTEAKHLYENKFGFIFIAYTNGKTVDDILAICRARLGNSSETELKIAAEAQQKIIEASLRNLLEQ